MRFVITEEEKKNIKKLYIGLLSEQEYGPMFSVEEVIDFPNQDASSIYNNILMNRNLLRNGKVITQVAPKQITIQKEITVDRNLWKTVGKNPIYVGHYGYLTFEINVLVKDNKIKVVIDNFNFNSPQANAATPWKINPFPMNEPEKGLTQKNHWKAFEPLIKKLSSEIFPIFKETSQSQDF